MSLFKHHIVILLCCQNNVAIYLDSQLRYNKFSTKIQSFCLQPFN